MPDYQQSKIYKLWSPSKNLVYYGSTVQSLAQRLTKHKCNYKRYNDDNTKSYLTSYLVLDCEDYKIELVEDYPCNNRQQLLKKEGEYIKNNECINNKVAGRTQAENYQDNKEEKIKAVAEYRKNNIEKIRAYDIERNKSEERKAKMREYDKTRRLKRQDELNKKDEIKL